MSRNKASAFLLTVLAAVAMTLGLTAGTANAAPATKPTPPKPTVFKNHTQYPPLPPVYVVNKGVVKRGVSVKTTGRMYGKKEKVVITVTFKPKGSNRFRTVKTAAVKTDKNGKFTYSLKLPSAGIVIITAVGKSSRKAASVSVYVIDKKKGGWWDFRRAAFTTGATTAVPAKVGGVPSQPAQNNAGLAVAGLGVLALAGSTLITRRIVRRRQRA
ncbi:hypothetical protein [Actinoplanes sp. NPDC049265]|uniref:hypothetical protein n=1 Tax=Actinoplanes sp. NPDC049265 TaxID=3363902 RepID=UPI003720E5C1